MALELTNRAEAAIKEFFQREDAITKLGDLYADVLSQVEKRVKADKPVEFVHTILDVAVQKVVEKLSWELLKVPDATLSSVGVPALLDLCIAGVGRKFLINSAPYKVLEDLMEGQTISNCEKLWTLLETRKEKLTTSDFIPEAGRNTKASLCLLKMCNALLRRLSKTHNSVFCGKILVFLSFTFALSERSAVNLMGKPNVSNVTAFEDQDAFDTAEATDSAAVADAVPSFEIDKEQHGADAGPIDYNLYRTFWDLQRYFREHELAVQSADNWEKFFDELNVVLSAFEGNAFSSDDLERTKDLLSAQAQSAINGGDAEKSNAPSSQDHFFQPKYLTNSRLFRLQLRDPILRECMLTQFLILFNYLSKAKLPSDVLTPKSKVLEMHDRVVKLLKQTPSDGEGFSEMVSRVLERERNWTKWKQEKCPPYEKYPKESAKGELSPKKKPRLGDAGALGSRPLMGMMKRTRQAPAGGDSSLLEQILTESSKPSQILEKIKGDERATEVPLQNYLDRFTEAWDPENGIEEAYWPDKDKMHCWRTMRVSMKASVEHMDLAINGAGALVKGILKIQDKPKEAAVTPTAAGTPTELTSAHEDVESDVNANGAVASTEKAEKVKTEVEKQPVAVVKEERRESSSSTSTPKYSGSSSSSSRDARPPLKRGRSDDNRVKEEPMESTFSGAIISANCEVSDGISAIEMESEDGGDDDTLDYELNLLVVQFQKYACRRLYVSDVWFICLVLLWLLLRYKADINAITKNQPICIFVVVYYPNSKLRESALIVACRKKRMCVVKFLLEHGASPDGLDRTGYSALRWVVEHEHLRMLRLLLFHNASVMKDCYTSNSDVEVAMKGSTKTHAIMVDFLQQRLVDERRELLVQVTLKKEQDEVNAISKFRKKEKKTKDKQADSVDGDSGSKLQDKSSQLTRRRRHRRLGQQLKKVHVTASKDATSQASSTTAAEANEGLLENSDALKRSVQERLDGSAAAAGVWVRAGPGKWKAQRREVASATSTSATPQASEAAAAVATQVVAFDATLEDNNGKRTKDLLKSDVRWNAFLKTINSELGHEAETNLLHLEDLE